MVVVMAGMAVTMATLCEIVLIKGEEALLDRIMGSACGREGVKHWSICF